MVPEETPSTKLGNADVFSYSLFVIGVVLLAIGVPCLIGLLCFFLGR